MKSALIISIMILGCTGCMRSPPPVVAGPDGFSLYPDASYLYKGDITRDGGTNCWYRC